MQIKLLSFKAVLISLASITGILGQRVRPQRCSIYDINSKIAHISTVNVQGWEIPYDGKDKWRDIKSGFNGIAKIDAGTLSFSNTNVPGTQHIFKITLMNDIKYVWLDGNQTCALYGPLIHYEQVKEFRFYLIDRNSNAILS